MKPEFSKPFSAADARAGAPFSGANGEAVRVLIWDRKHPKYPILAIEEDGEQEAIAFRVDGKATHGYGAITQELVMLPLGLIDGKPVFVGDRLLDGKGAEFTVTAGQVFGPGCLCKWAPPAKVYPETTMTGPELAAICAKFSGDFRDFANATLRHAVDAGQAVPKGEHEAALHRLGERLKEITLADWAARDMVIAKAVRHACYTSSQKAIGQIDLATLISTVK